MVNKKERKYMNIKKYERDIRQANKKRGLPGLHHGFKCIAVQYQEYGNEWSITLDTPFGEGVEPIGKSGLVEYIYERFGLLKKAFWEQQLKNMSQVETKRGMFWRVTLKVTISPSANHVGVPEEEGRSYLTIQAIQKLLDSEE